LITSDARYLWKIGVRGIGDVIFLLQIQYPLSQVERPESRKFLVLAELFKTLRLNSKIGSFNWVGMKFLALEKHLA